MIRKAFFFIGMLSICGPIAMAGDLKIALPKRSKLTPVQNLNREGVEAIRRHQYEKARTLFYRAYLFDPNDPFTLNNLGYIAELDGQVDRALQFYNLAAQQPTDAKVDLSSSKEAEGQSFLSEVSSIGDLSMRINRANVEAVRLLSQGRAPEADLLLQQTLRWDPKNPFTLNNMGVAKEMEGELSLALSYYAAAAGSRSHEAVVVTVNEGWRGKPVSEMASESAKKVQERLRGPESAEAKAAEMNLRGVAAVNRNEWHQAEQDFRQAYSLDPYSAFSLNNIGYLAEMQGDSETAQLFYERARQAQGANQPVGLATRRTAEGKRLFQVADDSDHQIDAKIAAASEMRRHLSGPIELKRRDNTPVNAPSQQESQPLPSEPNH